MPPQVLDPRYWTDEFRDLIDEMQRYWQDEVKRNLTPAPDEGT
jgi:hypothetical protein